MYFRLQQLHKAPFSNYDKSITFLNGLAGTDYTDQVNTLLTTVENYHLDKSWTNEGEAGLLPEHLRIPALASRITPQPVRSTTCIQRTCPIRQPYKL